MQASILCETLKKLQGPLADSSGTPALKALLQLGGLRVGVSWFGATIELTVRCEVSNGIRWWFGIFFIFTPKIGEDEPIFDDHIFQMGWEKTTNQMDLTDFFHAEIMSDVLFVKVGMEELLRLLMEENSANHLGCIKPCR